MSTNFILPDLGEGIHEAEILNVMVSEGEQVKEDQPIFEVETDKAVVQIPSPYSGTIEKIHVKQGQLVTVGSVMVSFNVHAQKEVQAMVPARSAQDPGPRIAPETTKKNGKTGQQKDSANTTTTSQTGPVPCAPATRRLARELGVDLKLVKGSGPGSRVLAEDIKKFARQGGGSDLGTAGSATPNGQKRNTIRETSISLQTKYGGSGDEQKHSAEDFQRMGAQPVQLPDFTKYGPVERIPLKSIRRKIALNMSQAWTHIPHVTHGDEADVSELTAFLAKYQGALKARGGKLTLTVFVLKAIAESLKQFPQFNASLDEQSGEIIFKHYYNIGVAVATERGLIVPVIKDVDKKNIVALSLELAEIAKKTRLGKIELERLQGGTFTLTNIGSIGGTSMSPMVNFPEAAILGMARANLKPVVRDGNIVARTILPLALSFDHRIADGAEAAFFVNHIVARLAEPLTFLLEELN